MVNKKLAMALCLGLVSNVALCNLQTLATAQGAWHVGLAAAGIALTVLCTSPVLKNRFHDPGGPDTEYNRSSGMNEASVAKTYVIRLMNRAGLIPRREQFAVCGFGSGLGLCTLALAGNEVKNDLQQKEKVPATPTRPK